MTTQFTIDVSSHVDGLEGKHAVYLWLFALFGNSSGFVAEGGNIADSGNPAPYQAAAPLRLYEKVVELWPAL